MRIHAVSIKNYRSLKNIFWEPAGLNVLIGPNGSGKSNLLRALEIMKLAATGPKLAETMLSQGGLSNIAWDRTATEISWTVLAGPFAFSPKGEDLEYSLILTPSFGSPSGFRVELEHVEEFGGLTNNGERSHRTVLHRSPQKIELRNPLEQRSPLSGIIDELKPESLPPDQTFLALSPFSHARIWELREYFTSWEVYHDIPVHEGAEIRRAAVTRVENRLASDGQNLIPTLHTLYTAAERSFRKSVDAAMRTAFGSDFEEIEFAPAADQRIGLRIRWKGLSSPQWAADLSDGTIRFLVLLTILGNPAPGSLIAIDEPEMGLHPGMLPIIAEFAAEAASRTTVILTTHSPDLLDAFDPDNAPQTVVTKSVNGETKITPLGAEELQRWLKEFRLGALFRSGELEEMS